MDATDDNRILYHEKQVAALCGVHCVNTLLQGPYFSEVDLSQIAQQLDALERQFMQEGGMESEDYKNFLSEESGNVAADGMFSIQVLCKALDVWTLQVIPLDSPEVRDTAGAEPQNEQAFVCNLQEHWLTIRKVGDSWWNFNSLFPAPQALSQFYLAAFLDTLKEQGYTIFVVRGTLPPLNKAKLDGPGKWYTPDEARQLHEEADKARQKGRLANALETALSQLTSKGNTVTLRPRGAAPGTSATAQDAFTVYEDHEADINAAIAASLADGDHFKPTEPNDMPARADGSQGAGQFAAVGAPLADVMEEDDEDMDPDLAAAIAASLSDMHGGTGAAATQVPSTSSMEVNADICAPGPAPEAGEDTLDIAFRLQDGKRIMRRFNASDTVGMLYGYLQQEGVEISKRQLSNQFPRKAFPPSSTSLSEAGVEHRQVLSLELIP